MAAEKPKPDAPAANAEAVPKPKKRFGTPIIVAVIMIVEGGGIFAVMKMSGSSPAESHAAHVEVPASKPALEDVELPVAQLRALNVKSGRPVLYSMRVFVRISAEHSAAFKDLMDKRKATIDDAVARIVRSAEPTHLSEDGLETLRRQIQFELGRLSQPEWIEEILIPECTPYPTGF